MESYKKANNTLFLLAFADAGYAHNKFASISNTFDNIPVYGYGIGLEWIIWYNYMLRFELSNNHVNLPGAYVSFKMGI